MAMYPAIPANRMAYDIDGTLGFTVSSGGTTITALTEAQLRNLNDENDSTAVSIGSGGYISLLFPEPRDIVALWRRHSGTGEAWDVSSDTTNGFDGTWTEIVAGSTATATTQPNYRVEGWITAFTAEGVTAIRARNTSGGSGAIQTAHIFGRVSADTPDKLEFWHPTLDQRLDETPDWLNYGDLQRNTGDHDVQVRLKNLSPSLTANTITISRTAPTDSSSPTKLSEMSLNYDGGSFGTTASIASLAPGAVSNLITVRKAPGATAVLGLWAQRITASAASWS